MPTGNNEEWPAWANGPLVLFHGTTRTSADDIVSNGIRRSKFKPNRDFGLGFYTTTLLEQAFLFADNVVKREGGDGMPQVVRFELDRRVLSRLRSIAFIRGELDAIDFWSFVSSCRLGVNHMPQQAEQYDVVYGPVAKAWFGPNNSSLHLGYDQVSFHTTAAIAALNATSPVLVTL